MGTRYQEVALAAAAVAAAAVDIAAVAAAVAFAARAAWIIFSGGDVAGGAAGAIGRGPARFSHRRNRQQGK